MDLLSSLAIGLAIGVVLMFVVGLPLDRLERRVNAWKRLKARKQK